MDEQSKAVVSCEGIPALFHFNISDSSRTNIDVDVTPLPGNPVDVVMVEGYIIASLDNIHQPGSTSVVDESNVSHGFKPIRPFLNLSNRNSDQDYWQ